MKIIVLFILIFLPFSSHADSSKKNSWALINKDIEELSQKIQTKDFKAAKIKIEQVKLALNPTKGLTGWEECNRLVLSNFFAPFDKFVVGYETLLKKDFFNLQLYANSPVNLKNDIVEVKNFNSSLITIGLSSNDFEKNVRFECGKLQVDAQTIEQDLNSNKENLISLNQFSNELSPLIRVTDQYVKALELVSNNMGKWKIDEDNDIEFNDSGQQKIYDDILDEVEKLQMQKKDK